MTVPGNINAMLLGGQSSYKIERSLRFNSADSAYLSRTPASAGNQTTWTWSGWIKRSSLGSGYQRLFYAGDQSSSETTLYLYSDESIEFEYYAQPTNYYLRTSAVLRDPSAWYHVVAQWNTADATSTNRMRLFVNGIQVTAFAVTSYPAQNTTSNINAASAHWIGQRGNNADFFSGYLTEIHFIDGQALTASSFGEINPVTGVWQPKRYTGTYGTNGFYLNFADNSGTTSTTLGKDSSGNGNNWTPNNFSVTAGSGNDSLIDTPTPYADGGNGRGNYCTLNPLDRYGATLSNGNLDWAMSGQFGGMQCCGTWALGPGKWYWEVNMTYTPNSGYAWMRAGLALAGTINRPVYNISVWYGQDGTVGTGYGTVAANASAWAQYNDVVQIAFDRDSGKVWFGKNGTWSNNGNPAAGSNANITGIPTTLDLVPALDNQTQGGYAVSGSVNFGQRPFAYTPPAGFLALNTQNLPEPTIKKPSSYMDVVTYTGTGSALTPTTGLGFSPDLVWIKSRSAATDHAFYDAVRGTEKRLESNNTDAEVTSDGGVTAFNSAGFSLGTLAQVNTNAATYAAWCWDKSATPGFDIVTYAGTGSAQTIAHSLGVAPSMIIVKERNNARNWFVWHTSLGATQVIEGLNTAAAATTQSSFNNTLPTSSVFSVGAVAGGTNGSGSTFVAYLWSEVAGFSKFGSYTGNGSSDGPFVYCGFRPRWVMIKRSDSTSGWHIYDTARSAYNVNTVTLAANLADSESSFTSGYDLDVLSNGFKARTGPSIAINTSGGTYIFAAFAESPFKYSLAR